MPELQNISKSFGQNHVLSGINMTFEQGQTDTLVGGNGTGETTLFNLITGFLCPDQGRLFTSRRLFPFLMSFSTPLKRIKFKVKLYGSLMRKLRSVNHYYQGGSLMPGEFQDWEFV